MKSTKDVWTRLMIAADEVVDLVFFLTVERGMAAIDCMVRRRKHLPYQG